MRGEALNLQQIVPAEQLQRGLAGIIGEQFGPGISIAKLDRRISEYCSSFIIEELDLTLSDGTTLALVFKDLSQAALLEGAGRVKPWFFYDPMREIEAYRSVLARHPLGTAKFYGAVVDTKRKLHWLFIERVPPVLLWQMGEIARWQEVARWLAGMHRALATETRARNSRNLEYLLRYDSDFYWRWMKRGVTFVCEGDKSAAHKAADAVRWLSDRYEPVVQRMLKLPVTIIHGEFFASNVMIDDRDGRLRVCPVDWEMAGVGPALVDLAALTSGNWTPAQKDAMAGAYYDALPDNVPEKPEHARFLEDLEYCRLAQAVQWLGWSPAWSPPPEHAQDWLREAVNCAQRLGL